MKGIPPVPYTCVLLLQIFSSGRDKASVRADISSFPPHLQMLLKNACSFVIAPLCGHASLLGFFTVLQKKTCSNVLLARVFQNCIFPVALTAN